MQSFCVHGHFYQPPREDPLTGQIPFEPGASPYPNWNERIHDHCYRPNAQLGNFSRISFNVGPTLFDWMTDYDPAIAAQIIQEDRTNYQQFGVGNALAQAFNHTILPLSSREDKRTQISWGIADFNLRYGHAPQGMWLPEAAVDLESLDLMAEYGIQFTILAPWQAAEEHLDVTQPYQVRLPSGRTMVVFFYHQGLSSRVSFDPGATSNAERFFWEILMPEFRINGQNILDQFILIASDGELYGHHQPFRDKFLAYLLDDVVRNSSVKTLYPGLWLKTRSPGRFALIRENTSWSCHHGVERWRGECGCTPNGAWKKSLRKAIEIVGDLVDAAYLREVSPYVSDPWLLRDGYIHVILGQISAEEYIHSSVKESVDAETVQIIALLLQAQYERQRMFTSCGWFFDDFERIEPTNNVAYAAHAVWLTNLATGSDHTAAALSAFRSVASWRTGRRADVVFSHQFEQARAIQQAVR